MQRHAYFVEASVAALLQAWRSHFERVPAETAERKHLIIALGTLGSGTTPRDSGRISTLPASLLEPSQLASISEEIEAVHQDMAKHTPAAAAPAAKL
jgi:hypothetical protein